MSELQPAAETSDQEANQLTRIDVSARDGSPTKQSPATSPRADGAFGVQIESPTKKSSPVKPTANANKLPAGMDVSTSSLAAISARLMPQFTPAELEIARINREVLRNGRLASGDEAGDGSLSTSMDPSASSPSRVAAALATASKPGGSALHDSLIAEEWVNLHLESSGSYLLPASDIQALMQRPDVQGGTGDTSVDDEEDTFAFRRRGENSGPLARAGIDRWTLYRLGMPKHLVDRLYRALYVYTNGFHNIINEIASHCPPTVEKHVSSNVWLTFLLLLEQCENGKYEMAMLKFKQATQEWRKEMHEEFLNEKSRMEAHAQQLETQLQEEQSRSAEKSELIDKLSTETVASNTRIGELEEVTADLTEQVRLLKLEIMVHEDIEKKLNIQLDDARKDFEMANSERFNALTERYALDEEMLKLQNEIERLEAEKSNYAKRMHETLFMNQALRSSNDTLKQNIVVLNIDKEKLENEKQASQAQVSQLEQDLTDIKLLKASVEHDLVESTRRQAHVEERLRAMKEQLDAELENTTRYVKEISNLTAQFDEEKVKVGVLEAKCNLLTAEKQNTGMRAQDKLRIERLLNQKLELENQIETMKLERAKDQEQIWNLKSSLEALDSELQQTKRVFSAGQQAFLHSERTAEKLRNQLQDVEKNYEKASKNLASLRERFKMFEESSKEQVTKLEVELKVTGAQLREVTYVNRDNAAVIADLTKSLEAAEKETKKLKNKLEKSEKMFNELMNEKENLQRDQQERDQQHSSSKQIITKFIRELQSILALVKIDEYPLDEALREVLRMVKETFGHELDITKVLDDEDEPIDFEEEYDEDELAEVERERRSRLSARRAGFSVGINPAGSLDDEVLDGSDKVDVSRLPGCETDADGKRRLTKVSRMSKFRRSKLDNQVRKLQREVETKTDFVRSLEGVVCSQADEIAILTAKNDQQMRWLKLNEQQKGMLLADIESHAVALKDSRALLKKTDDLLQQAKINLVMETNKTFQMELSLQKLRHQFDIECATTEDLMGKIWRAYEHELLMRSLRREKAIQATVTVADDFSQTLVPQRNPVLERVRIPAMNMPSINPTAQQAESLINQINETAKALLPNVTSNCDLQLQPSLTSLPRPALPAFTTMPQHQQQAMMRPVNQAPRQPANNRNRGERHRHRHLTGGDRNPATQAPPSVATVPPQLVRHFNEFGMRQDVLISPVYPPYFPSHAPPTQPMVNGNRPGSKMPRKPQAHRQNLSLNLGNGDERSDGWDPRVHSVSTQSAQQPQQHMGLPHGGSRLRYHRGFLRAGMEVLRGSGGSRDGTMGLVLEEDDDYDADGTVYDDYGRDDDGDEDDPTVHDGDRGDYWRSQASFHSPSKLELAVRDFHDEQDAAIASGSSPRHSPSRYYAHRLKEDESRASVAVGGDDPYQDDDDAGDDDPRNSRFVPGVLYPLLPPR